MDIRILPLFALMCAGSLGSQMDPHVYPDTGPFFEGWYLRVIDPPQNVSIAFLFGLVLPEASKSRSSSLLFESMKPFNFQSLARNSDRPLAASSLLISLSDGSKTESPCGYFTPSQYSVTKNGQPVKQDPDDTTPPQFEAKIASNVSFVVTPEGSKFDLTIGDHHFEGATSTPVPWGPNGEGPESWLENFPLPISWFVYSLRSTVQHYKYTNRGTGVVVEGPAKGKTAVAHLEKNWGRDFPPAWIWAEGTDPATEVSFAFSSGVITELGIGIPAQLTGYRNPKKGIACNFQPLNSLHFLEHDGCAGTAKLTVKSLSCSVVFDVRASPGTFSDCLPTPQVDGFAIGCKESFSAVANITVHQLCDNAFEQTDHQVIRMAALEFGEEYVCNRECTP